MLLVFCEGSGVLRIMPARSSFIVSIACSRVKSHSFERFSRCAVSWMSQDIGIQSREGCSGICSIASCAAFFPRGLPCFGGGGASARVGLPSALSSCCSRLLRISLARAMIARRQAGEARDLDAVALVGAAGDDLAQEDDLLVPFAHGDVVVAHAGAGQLELGQLVVVRGEERARLDFVVQIFRDAPGDARGRRRSRCRGRFRRG